MELLSSIKDGKKVVEQNGTYVTKWIYVQIPKYSLKFLWGGGNVLLSWSNTKDWEIAQLFLIRILMQLEIWFQTIQYLKYEVKLFKILELSTLSYFRLLKSLILIVKMLWRLGITSKMSIAIYEWKH